MDPHTQTTFIPKKPVTTIDSERRGIGFFSLIALIIFLSTLVIAGGVFAYKYTLEKSISSADSEVKPQEKKFDPDFIAFIVRLNQRIEVSKNLLNRHVAVSSIFDSLERSTLQTVQFKSFNFSSSPIAGKDVLRLTLTGIAKDYGSLAAQSQEIGKNKYIKEPLFSNFTLNEEGRVNFDLVASIDPKLIDYRARLSGEIFDSDNSTTKFVPDSNATSTTKTQP